jgi:putative ABC transport system ATP-binding protein
MAIFQRLNDAGRTIVVVPHEPDIAALCKRVVRFCDGHMVSDELVADPIDAPQALAGSRSG